MARRFQLTWLQDSRRWRKRYKGKAYYFPAEEAETKLSSYRRCLDEWSAKKTEIDNNDFTASESYAAWQDALAMAAESREKARDKGNRDNYRSMDELVRLTEASIERKRLFPDAGDGIGTTEPLPPNILGPDPWDEKTTAKLDTVAQAVDKFLEQKQSQVQRNSLSPGRYDVIQRCIGQFAEHIGRAASVTSFDGNTLLDYHAAMDTKVASEEWSPSYAKEYMATAKQFMRWCWETGLLDQLPRNFDSPSLRIKVDAQPVTVLSVDEVKKLLGGARDRTKLFLLLTLNCGMLQQDMSDIRQEEVDWVRGRIKRKRSKTARHDKVPTVEYVLWSETFALLKKFRSADPTVALLNRNGRRLKTEVLKDGKLEKTDCVRNAYDRLVKTLKIAEAVPLKVLRKTGASMIANHAGEDLAKYYLGHSPNSVADRHYIQPPTERLDAAITWLGEQLGVTVEPEPDVNHAGD